MAEEIIDEYGFQVDTITLTRGDGGRFEVDVDGKTVFSKTAAGRHANPGEILATIKSIYGEPL